jgi:hypothetical protein
MVLAARLQSVINVETLHPVEIKHVYEVFSFRQMQSFHDKRDPVRWSTRIRDTSALRLAYPGAKRREPDRALGQRTRVSRGGVHGPCEHRGSQVAVTCHGVIG